jgi:hypothetical protein
MKVVGTRGSGVRGSEKCYLTDICSYTHTVHIKDQAKEAVNLMILNLLEVVALDMGRV